MTITIDQEPTLAEALTRAGFRHEPHTSGRRRVFDADGVDLGPLTAADTWAILRERDLLGPPPAAACPRCGGWTGYGGMSQFRSSATPVLGRTGCTCTGAL